MHLFLFFYDNLVSSCTANVAFWLIYRIFNKMMTMCCKHRETTVNWAVDFISYVPLFVFVGFKAEYQMFCKLKETKNIPIRQAGFVLTRQLWSTGERVVNRGLFLTVMTQSVTEGLLSRILPPKPVRQKPAPTIHWKHACAHVRTHTHKVYTTSWNLSLCL